MKERGVFYCCILLFDLALTLDTTAVLRSIDSRKRNNGVLKMTNHPSVENFSRSDCLSRLVREVPIFSPRSRQNERVRPYVARFSFS